MIGNLGVYLLSTTKMSIVWSFRARGGGKCPEEEHTTCSGGPTINCHKRGLWGERIFYFIRIK